jgi:hypothetical protein
LDFIERACVLFSFIHLSMLGYLLVLNIDVIRADRRTCSLRLLHAAVELGVAHWGVFK